MLAETYPGRARVSMDADARHSSEAAEGMMTAMTALRIQKRRIHDGVIIVDGPEKKASSAYRGRKVESPASSRTTVRKGRPEAQQ